MVRRARHLTVGIILAAAFLIPFAISGSIVHAQTDPAAAAQLAASTNTNASGATPGNVVSPSSCSVVSFSNGFDLNCFWITAMSWLGSWFLTVGGGLLRLAGILFDSLVFSVIVQFKETLTTMHIMDPINNGWTIFRDFTNILIIGLFVFIAISIILGLKEFGQKKLIANVLIIAVLINFSLLFCEVVIDGSNFVAYQIYRQMAGNQQAQTFDIAAGFLKPMGITSVWNDTALVTAAVGQKTNSGLQAFLFGLVGGILLFAAAAVIFYGCFLIMARAVLFIFLMLTAALAFATYLVPSLAHGEYGWSAWWKALFNNAVFAPLLMLFLAVSLAIVNTAGKSGLGGGDLGAWIANPSQTSAVGVIITYILGVGLLFLSFRMASKFAGTISGFSIAGSVISTPFAAALRGLSPVLTRAPGIGSSANLRRSMELEDQVKTARLDAAAGKGNYDRVLDLMKKKEAADKAASRTFAPLSSDLGKLISKATNVPKVLTEKPKDPSAEAKKIAAEAAKAGASAVVSKNEAENYVKKQLEEEHADALNAHKERKEESAAIVQLAKSTADAVKNKEGLGKTRDEARTEELSAARQKAKLDQDKMRGLLSSEEHKRSIDEQDARIKAAKEKLENVELREAAIDKDHNLPQLKEIAKVHSDALASFDRNLTQQARKEADTLVQRSREGAEHIAAHEVEHHGGDSTVAELARRKIGGTLKTQRLRERIKVESEMKGELGGEK